MAGRTRQTQAERVETSENRLLDAAAELFLEHGYHATSAADIAARAGYSREMVRTRFGSKLALAQRLVRSDYMQAMHDIELPEPMNALERLRARSERLAMVGRTAPLRVRAAFVLGFESAISVPELEPDFAPWLERGHVEIAAEIKEAIADGLVLPVDAERVARLIVDASTGGAFASLRSGDTLRAAEASHLVIDLIAVDDARG